MKLREVRTDQAPEPVGPYSQAIISGDTVYTAGQIGIDPATGEIAADVEAQTRQVMDNLAAVLAAAGCAFADVVKTTIYLADMADFPAVNAIYGSCFGDPAPARAMVEAAALPKGASVEIDCIAVIPLTP